MVKRPPDQLWDPVREFWQESGFLLAIEQKETGIIETDFAENRAKLPQDIIRRTLGRVLDSLYSTSERDKFRTRLERTAEGTEIYISHRGMVETVPGNASSGSTIWQPRPADPELETEFLRRLMIKLGVSAEQARSAAEVSRPSIARVESDRITSLCCASTRNLTVPGDGSVCPWTAPALPWKTGTAPGACTLSDTSSRRPIKRILASSVGSLAAAAARWLR